MSLELKIHGAFSHKALSIILAVLISIGFSFGGAMANSCQGDADCPVCVEAPHGHASDAAPGVQDPDCPPAGQNSTCGFEASQDPDGFRSIVSPVRPYRQVYAGIFAAVSDEYGQIFLQKEFVPQILLSDSDGAAPIYILNQSLLC
jgi:hypothetical protein